MRARIGWVRALLVCALVAEAGVLAVGLGARAANRTLWTELAAVALFVLAVAALARAQLGLRGGLFLVVGAGIVLQAATLTSAPSSSDDYNRYIWDAKIQLAGIDPYRYPPSAPQLAARTSGRLFEQGPGCLNKLPDGRCTKINRPTVRTVYPPVAEGAFALARLADPRRSDGSFPLQLMAAIGSTALSVLLAWRANRLRRRAWSVGLWAWCPVSVVELAGNAHIDWLAALLSVAALMSAGSERPSGAASAAGARRGGWRTGLLIGSAIATKLYPGIVLPVLLRRQPLQVLIGALSLVCLVYLPHVLAVGTRVIGFLPGYLTEENYTDGSRYLILSGIFGHGRWVTGVAALVLAVGAGLAYRWTDPGSPELTGVWLVGLVLLVSTPSYSWYAVLLVALVAMTARLEWLPLAIFPTFSMLGAQYYGGEVSYRRWWYVAGLVCALAGWSLRRRLTCAPMPATLRGPAAAAGAGAGPDLPRR